jgi:Fe-S oxidoreductase
VDIAKLKAEYAAQGYARGRRISIATRLIANVRAVNRLGSSVHPIANFVNRLRLTRGIVNRAAGFHPRRELPRFGQSLPRWMARRGGGPRAGAPVVVLYPDCFTTYNEPHIGRAAVRVLEAFGYRVVLPKVGCCGRPHISTGLLHQAQSVCRSSARMLLEIVRETAAVAVVACEPSCLSAIKDEWLELDMDVDAASLRDVTAKSFLVEQFIETAWERHPKRPTSPAGADAHAVAPPIILHGHCHQKALWGVQTSARILQRFFGERLQVLDSGCCGMAGQFGYAREHYDLSMKIAEQSLFASLRARPGAIVCAPGTSCRQQVHDGMDGRPALHPMELIASALGVNPA